MVSSKVLVYRSSDPGGILSSLALLEESYKKCFEIRARINDIPPGSVYRYVLDDTIIMCMKTVLRIKSGDFRAVKLYDGRPIGYRCYRIRSKAN